MSRIDSLIAKYCPNGVEFKALGDIADLVRGNGMPKSDFTESGVGCIHYGQIYTHYGISTTETISFVAPKTAVGLAKVDTGDLIITNTSENIEDVCKAVAWLGGSQIVTGGHATVIKHQQEPKYLSYYFRSPDFFAQKKKQATGTKVIDVSAKNLAKILVPLPPIEIQREIVKVLDTFTQLEVELRESLEAELDARRQQYKHYRDVLLTFDEQVMHPNSNVGWTTLGEIGKFTRGRRFTNKDFVQAGVGCIHYGEIYTHYGL
jgi:type I restriction enzyme, S subunit